MRKAAGLSGLTIIICITAAIFAVLNIYFVHRLQVTTQNVYEHPYTVSNTASNMRSHLLDMKRFVSLFLTFDFDDDTDFSAISDERLQMQMASIEVLRTHYVGDSADIDTLQQAIIDLFAAQERASRYAGEGHAETEILNFIVQNVQPCYDAVEGLLDDIIRFADNKISDLAASAQYTAWYSILATLVLTAAIVFLNVRSNRTEQRSIQALTRRKRELKEALSLAEAANNAKKEFLSRMSHDMRTPLNSVLGGVHLAKIKLLRGQDAGDELELVEQAGQFLLNLINDVLDVSRIEAGKIDFHNDWCSPGKTLAAVVKVVSPMMEKKRLSFSFPSVNPAEEKLECFIDASRMQQVLVNLLSNAAKFTPEGGSIALTIQNLSHDGHFSTDRFTITDTGCGMSREFIAHIGEAFSQEENQFSGQVAGSGLGLFIVKKIVTAMGGALSVESEPGKGSAFSFTLRYPYRMKPAAAPSGEPDAPARRHADLSGMRVLCVEDNPINQIVISELLENEGVRATLVGNGLEAVDTFRASAVSAFDAILMDVRMPVMNGREATRAIRRLDRPDAKTVPIIAVSADAIHDEIEQAMAWGFTQYLTKPIDPEALYEALGRAKGRQGGPPPASPQGLRQGVPPPAPPQGLRP